MYKGILTAILVLLLSVPAVAQSTKGSPPDAIYIRGALVDTSGLADGQYLIYDSATNEWNVTSAAGSIALADSANTTGGAIDFDKFNLLNASDGDPDSALFVDATGEVGIGTLTPTSLLHIYGSANNLLHLQSTDGTVGIQMSDDATTQPVTIRRIGDNVIFVPDGGNVGIGAITPDEFIEIEDAASTRIHLDAGTTAQIRVDKGAVTDKAEIIYQTAGSDVWFTGTTDSDVLGDGDEFIIAYTGLRSTPFVFVETDGNIGLNAATFDGTAAKTVAIGNGTAPAAGTADQSYFYAKDVSSSSEMHVMDEAGNETQLSPHDPNTGKWIFYTKNVETGRVLRVEMEELIFDIAEEMSKKTGKKYIYESSTLEEVKKKRSPVRHFLDTIFD